MARSIRLSVALLLALPLLGACTIDPTGPDAFSGAACGSAGPTDDSCPENVPQGVDEAR